MGDYYYCYTRGYNPYISSEGLIQMLKNLPLLEELHLFYTRISGEGIEVAGRCCPNLKSFTWTTRQDNRDIPPEECDEEALAIAENMPGLQHLQLIGNGITITGIMAIINSCHDLEYLDLRQCCCLWEALEDPSVEKKLCQQIKHVRFPEDSLQRRIDVYDGLFYSDYYSDLPSPRSFQV